MLSNEKLNELKHKALNISVTDNGADSIMAALITAEAHLQAQTRIAQAIESLQESLERQTEQYKRLAEAAENGFQF